MSNSLKQDVCGQAAPGILVADVESSRIEQCLPPEVRYACLYWIQHLQKSDAQLCDDDKVVYYAFIHDIKRFTLHNRSAIERGSLTDIL